MSGRGIGAQNNTLRGQARAVVLAISLQVDFVSEIKIARGIPTPHPNVFRRHFDRYAPKATDNRLRTACRDGQRAEIATSSVCCVFGKRAYPIRATAARG